MNKNFKILGLIFTSALVLFLLLSSSSSVAEAGPLDDFSLGSKPFGGRVNLIIPPLPTCVFKKIKVGNPMPIEAYVVDFGPIESAINAIEKIPFVGGALAKPAKILLGLIEPTRVMKYTPIGFFEWSLGNTYSKTFSKPFLAGLKLIPPPFNAPFLSCDSDAYIIKFIGTSQNISL